MEAEVRHCGQDNHRFGAALQPAQPRPLRALGTVPAGASCARISIRRMVMAKVPRSLGGRVVEINLHGVIFGSKLALERFLPRNRGHLVQIASAAGKAGFPGGATYCATKHAVVGLSETLRAELRGTNVDVSVVMPVVVNTE